MQFPTTHWRDALRGAIFPVCDDALLGELIARLERDDPNLIQRGTTEPPWMPSHTGILCKGGCLIAVILQRLHGLRTVGEVMIAVRDAVFVPQASDEVAFLAATVMRYWDQGDRKQVFDEFLAEFRAERNRRQPNRNEASHA